jgi:hypothetical protein
MDDYYRILGLDPGASPDQVKEAYRDMAKVWHPDRFAHDPRLQQKAQERLKAINEAYEILKGEGTRTSQQDVPPEGSEPSAQDGPKPTQERYGPVKPVEQSAIFQRKSRVSFVWYLLGLLLLIVAGAIVQQRMRRAPAMINTNRANAQQASKQELANVDTKVAPSPSPNAPTTQPSETEDAQLDPYLVQLEPTTTDKRPEPTKESSLTSTQDSGVKRSEVGEAFTVGSTKNQVLEVQGTPDSFSENEIRILHSYVFRVN